MSERVRLVDGNALKKRIAKRREEIAQERKYGWEWEYNGLNAAIMLVGCEMVGNPVESEYKTGEWVKFALYKNNLNQDRASMNCSVCDEFFDGYPDILNWNFCPNCGSHNGGDK